MNHTAINNGTPLSTTQEVSRPLSIPSPPERRLSASPSHSTLSDSGHFQHDSNNHDVEKGTADHHHVEDGTGNRPVVTRQLTDASASGIAAPYCAATFPFAEKIVSNVIYEGQASRPRSASNASTLRPSQSNAGGSINVNLSRVSTDAYGNTYPEGGSTAFLCVFGSFCGCMLSLGMMNTIGTFQAYISRHQLSHLPESTIGWIFGVYAFLSFFCGVQIGPVFDAKGPRWLVASGSVLILLSYLLLGICTKYYQFLLVFGVLGGLGTSLVFTPAIASIGHFFLRERGQWTGLACVGGSLGGIVYPLVLQALFPRIGFAWSTRVIALINVVLAIFANLFIKARLPPKKATREAIMPDPSIFRDPVFSLATLGVAFIEWGLFVPLGYIASYAMSVGIDESFSYQIIAIFNVGSCFGRYFPGLIADKIGRFNAITLTVLLCMISTFALWLPAGDSEAMIISYSVIFGFASGSGISLTPVCVGQLCKTENYGRYYATCYTAVSFASLTGIPIAGALVSATGGSYWGLIVFTGCSYAASFAAFIAARGKGKGWGLRVKY